MNAAIAVGLPGPAPPATGKSPPARAGTGKAVPFTEALQSAGPPGPVVAHSGGEPPGPEPGPLDVVSLLQLLLDGDLAAGEQTIDGLTDQPDRLAGAGTNLTEDVAGQPVDGELLMALLAQLAAPSVSPEAASPTLATSVAAATVQPQATRGGSSTGVPTEAELPVNAGGSAIEGIAPGSTDKAPRVVLPSAAADAPRSDAAPVALPEGEQQHAIPLAAGATEDSSDSTTPAVEASSSDELAAAIEALEVEASDALPDELPLVERPVAEPQRPEVSTAASREPATPATADAGEATLPPVNQPTTTSNARSTAASTATEATAAPPTNEAFTAELAGTVRRASMLGDQEVRLLLNPPELGHLDVRVVESPEGLRIVLEATSAEARELIEQQLPALRNALEARDLKVERLQVEQALDASALDEQSERELRQDGQDNGSDQPGQDDAPWSPVASMRSGDGAESGGVMAAGGPESETQTATGDGRLDVLA